MSWIQPLKMNMDITRTIYENPSHSRFLATIQKVAVCSVIPLLLIASFEGVVKNLIGINLLNMAIVVLNGAHRFFLSERPC